MHALVSDLRHCLQEKFLRFFRTSLQVERDRSSVALGEGALPTNEAVPPDNCDLGD
jgi:hypothetical protein